MEATLFGSPRDSETKRILQILEDAGVVVFFQEIKHMDSPLNEAVEVLANTNKLPVMFYKGVPIVGSKAIREHIAERL
jgi:hypothetical protein